MLLDPTPFRLPNSPGPQAIYPPVIPGQPPLNCAEQATIDATFIRQRNYYQSYQNIKRACFTILDNSIDDAFKVSNIPTIVGWNTDELKQVSRRYCKVGLPGTMGSKDVMHVKWSRAPAGDFNRCKGKESYPTIMFQCISNFDWRIMGISHAQYGTRNDKSIVCRDHNVHAI
jgi:hypothetical protein